MKSTLLLVLCLCSTATAQQARQFERWDANGDGKLVPAELPAPIRGNFGKVDRDKDGFISKAEHQAFTSRKQTAGINDPKVELTRDVPYAGNKNPRQSLHLLLPKQRKAGEKLPVVVWIHGGAWRAGDKNSGIGRLRPYVSSGRYIGASIGYRLSDEAQWPAQIHDCKAAVRWLRGNAEKYGIDPERIGVFGSSAGGHLVAMLGTSSGVKKLEGDLGVHDDQSSKVQCVVNFYGPAEMLTMNDHDSTMDHDAPDSPESKLLGGTLQEIKELAREASPITHISKDDPPMLHIHGTADKLVPYPQSVVFDKALRKAGCTTALLTVKDGGHGGFRNPKVDETVQRFFDHHLRGIKADIPSFTLPAGERPAR